MKNKKNNWTICLECQGSGKKSRRLRKKVKLRYQRELDQFEKNNSKGPAPILPKRHLDTCLNCKGSGLLPFDKEAAIKEIKDQDSLFERIAEKLPEAIQRQKQLAMARLTEIV